MTAPALVLDFTTAPLDARVTFTRTTGASNPATYVNSSGVITAATNDQPRFDYDPVTLVCKGLLIEESRSNIVKSSGDLSNATYWPTAINGSRSVSSETGPGGVAAVLYTENSTASVSRYIAQSATLTAATTYTWSCYIKSNGRRWYYINAYSGGNQRSFFDLQNGVIGTNAAGNTSTITSVGNGWYRCTVTRTHTSGGSYFEHGMSNADNVTAYNGDGVSGIYLWGAQIEAGAFPTSYIPTTTAALTRNADVAVMTGVNFSDWWQAGLGGATVQALPSTVTGTRPLIQFDDGTVNEIISLRGNTTNPELYIVDGSVSQAQIDAGTIAANTAYSLTGWWQTNFCAARKDGGARVEDLTATIPTVTQARIGSDGTNYLNGHISAINYYDQFSGQIYTRRKNKAVLTVI